MAAVAAEWAGTIVDGRVELDHPAELPNGTRVCVWVSVSGEAFGGPPLEAEDREQELAILREALDDVRAGRGGVPHDVMMAEIATQFGLSLPKPGG